MKEIFKKILKDEKCPLRKITKYNIYDITDELAEYLEEKLKEFNYDKILLAIKMLEKVLGEIPYFSRINERNIGAANLGQDLEYKINSIIKELKGEKNE